MGVVPVRLLNEACGLTLPAQRAEMGVTSIGKLVKLNSLTGTNRQRALLQRLDLIANLIIFSVVEPLLTLHAKRCETHNTLQVCYLNKIRLRRHRDGISSGPVFRTS